MSLLVVLVVAPVALAQDGASSVAPPEGFEVMQVKGAAVSAIEAEVPESVTQFDAAAIQALGAQNIQDLAKLTPNVEIITTDSTSPTFFIRGVGLADFSSAAAGAVAIFQDDIGIALPGLQLSQLFDVEDVDLINGPKGWGAERNASGGAIKITSRKPTGELSASGRVSYGRFNAVDAEGTLEFPIVEQRLATRLAFRVTERDGFIDNRCAGAIPFDERVVNTAICNEITFANRVSDIPVGLESNLNDQARWAARGIFRFFHPERDMDWTLNVHGARLDELSTVGVGLGVGEGQRDQDGVNLQGSALGTDVRGYRDPDIQARRAEIDADVARLSREQLLVLQPYGDDPPPIGPVDTQTLRREERVDRLARELARNGDPDPYTGDYNRTGRTIRDTWGLALGGDWDFDGLDFETRTGFDYYDRFRDQDQDFTPNVLFESVTNEEGWQFWQSMKLAGNAAGTKVRWTTDVYFLKDVVDTISDSEGIATIASRDFEQTGHSFGISADFAYDFFEDFTLEGGIRYQWEHRELDFRITNNGIIQNVTDEVWQAPTGGLRLIYRLTDRSSMYWKYTRGFKSGTFNTSANLAKGATAAKPETIDALEIGLRGLWWERRVALNVAAFFYKYTNYQILIVESGFGSLPTLEVINASDAENYGLELNLRLEPLVDFVPQEVEGLSFDMRFGWLESQFLDFTQEIFEQLQITAPPDPIQFSIRRIPREFSGNRLLNSPRFTASFGVSWPFVLGRFGSLTPRWDGTWTGDVAFDTNESRGVGTAAGEVFLPEHTVGQRAYWLHSVRLGYKTPEGTVEVAGWVRNLTDQRYKTYAFDASAFTDLVANFVGEPRTYGGEMSFVW